MEAFDSAMKFPEESKQEAAALNEASDLFRSAGYNLGWLACGNRPFNVGTWQDKLNYLSKTLRSVALAVEGKLESKSKKLDGILASAWREKPGRMKADGSIVFPDDFYKRVKAKCKREGISPAPTLFAAKRRLKQLGWPYPWRKNVPRRMK